MATAAELRPGQLWHYYDDTRDLDYVVMLIKHMPSDSKTIGHTKLAVWLTMLVLGPSFGGPGNGNDLATDNMANGRWTLVSDVG